MENFRAKQYENLEFEGEVFSGGPCGCDYCSGECDCDYCADYIKQLQNEIVKLEEENRKLKSDLEECECNMHFENDEVGYRKRECKKLNIKVASLEGEIKGLNYTIEKLKEENQTLELRLDNKEKLNEEYRKQLDGYKM